LNAEEKIQTSETRDNKDEKKPVKKHKGKKLLWRLRHSGQDNTLSI
jgi:hypothetical protein